MRVYSGLATIKTLEAIRDLKPRQACRCHLANRTESRAVCVLSPNSE